MPAILLTVLLLYKLISSILLYLVPKKLRTYLPPSWSQQQENPKREPTIRPHKMDQDELKGVFRMLDRNGDGWITRDELRGSLEKMGIFVPADELAHMIDKIDMDEFEALYWSIVPGERESKGEEEMREAFDVFDLNGDGFITLDELRVVLAGMGLERGRAADDWKKMIMKVDADGDGMVDFSEFKRMMRGGAFAASGN